MMKSRYADGQPLVGRAVMITGGSQGIGLAVAKEVMRLGASVCIIAVDGLAQAKKEIESLRVQENQYVEAILCDVTDQDALEPLIREFVGRRGIPDYLFNFVGYACARNIADLRVDDFKQNMDVNYYGQLVPTLVILSHYLKNRVGGHISFTSSVMGCFGIMGYAAYAPTKHALVGLAEVLRNELMPFSIKISVLYPPDTRTPGFQRENQAKPPACAVLSGEAELLDPEDVARTFVSGVLKNRFQIFPGKAKLYWRLFRYFPSLMRAQIDRRYARARKKVSGS